MPNSHSMSIYLSFLANSMSYISSDKLSTRRELQEIDTQFVCFSQKFYFYLYRLLSTRCHYITYLGKWQYQLYIYIYIASTQKAKQNILAIANVVLIIKHRYTWRRQKSVTEKADGPFKEWPLLLLVEPKESGSFSAQYSFLLVTVFSLKCILIEELIGSS